MAVSKYDLFKYLVENSFESPPSVRELCAALYIKSTSTVYKLLHELEEDGLITITKGKRRNISVNNFKSGVKVPLLGTVAAGLPILAQQNIEGFINFDSGYSGQELFALRVKGDSMINAAILDGDIIISKTTPTAENGEIVVALIDDEATVKRFFKKDDYIELHAENPNYPPIKVKEASIIGKVIAVVRYY